MKKEKKKIEKGGGENKISLSPAKKRIFWAITISIPVVLFLLLEILLRIFDYGGNLDLFIDGPPGYENYLRPNLNVARRYFSQDDGVPTPPLQLFLKEKTENAYRIFVLGGSSTAGFPYGNNVSFPNILRRALSKTFPDKNIEVINIAMSAVNSYTLLDLTDEIIDQSPDAILIYAGHNEYYGALGVGSVQSIGNWRGLIRAYLNLHSVKTFLMLRDFIGWVQSSFGKAKQNSESSDIANTLMSRIVDEQVIPYGSPLYEMGKEQFRENVSEIIERAKDKGIKVVIAELVSNLSDQNPLISINDGSCLSADSLYNEAKKYEISGNYINAEVDYIKAKDNDALRFRAPEELNDLIHDFADKYSIPLVSTYRYFKEASQNGLIGNNLILEHLHPNKEGYFILAKAFYEKMRDEKMISDDWSSGTIEEIKNSGITELDSVYAGLVIRNLKEGWPFQPKEKPNTFFRTFKPSNKLEEISLRIMTSSNFNIEAAHMELGRYYESKGELDKAFDEFEALIASIPHEIDFYENAVSVLIKAKEYDKANDLLMQSMKYKSTEFNLKWIGQIALLQNNYKKAITYLSQASLTDPQILFNLSRAYYYDNQFYKGEEYFSRLTNLAPKSQYVSNLQQLRIKARLLYEKSKSQ